LLRAYADNNALSDYTSPCSSTATMASKCMVNAAFEARLLFRPSHQRTVLFGTVNKLEYPIPGRPTLPPIPSSRLYSDSTSTPPFPKPSGPTKSSQSPGPEDRNWFHPKGWVKGRAALTTLAGGLGLIGVVRATSFSCHLKYTDYQRVFSYMPSSQLVI
jgi:hypothetical protein